MVTMFISSDIRKQMNYKYKHFLTFRHVCYRSDKQFAEIIYSSTDGLRNCFILQQEVMGKKKFFSRLWCMELDFLILLIVFIHKVCDRMSNRNIPDPNEYNLQLLARLWNATKWRDDGKFYCPCTQCRGFKRRRILISTTTKHCREHGHAKGGNQYCPFVGLAL